MTPIRELKEYQYEVIIRGVVRAPSKLIAEALPKNGLSLSVALHDSIQDFKITVLQDPLDRLREIGVKP